MGFFRSKMFKLAKSISPDTLLFLNDYGIIMDRFLKNHGQVETMRRLNKTNANIWI